jgi:hypothetical protein
MRNSVIATFGVIVLLICLLQGCGQKDPLDQMKKIVPILEGAKILETKVADEKMGIIMMEVAVAKASQKEILDFYKSKMTDQGWVLKSLKDYGKNGSVMELAKEDVGTLSVMTILKKTDKTGIIPVTLNLAFL